MVRTVGNGMATTMCDILLRTSNLNTNTTLWRESRSTFLDSLPRFPSATVSLLFDYFFSSFESHFYALLTLPKFTTPSPPPEKKSIFFYSILFIFILIFLICGLKKEKPIWKSMTQHFMSYQILYVSSIHPCYLFIFR